MTDEQLIRGGTFFGIFLAMALWEVVARHGHILYVAKNFTFYLYIIQKAIIVIVSLNKYAINDEIKKSLKSDSHYSKLETK